LVETQPARSSMEWTALDDLLLEFDSIVGFDVARYKIVESKKREFEAKKRKERDRNLITWDDLMPVNISAKIDQKRIQLYSKIGLILKEPIRVSVIEFALKGGYELDVNPKQKMRINKLVDQLAEKVRADRLDHTYKVFVHWGTYLVFWVFCVIGLYVAIVVLIRIVGWVAAGFGSES